MGKKRYTTADREARAAEDRAIQAVADDVADDEITAERIAAMLSQAPSLARFSFGNLVLILTQATARGLAVTDLRTKKEWNRAGRLVSGPGIRIRVPVPKNEEEKAADAEKSGGNGDDLKRCFYRSRFDISQTRPFDDAEPSVPDAAEAATADGPAQTASDALAEAFETRAEALRKLGYQVTVWPADTYGIDPGQPVLVDHEAMTVQVAESGTDAAVFGGLLAAERDAAARHRKTPAPRATDDHAPVRLSI